MRTVMLLFARRWIWIQRLFFGGARHFGEQRQAKRDAAFRFCWRPFCIGKSGVALCLPPHSKIKPCRARSTRRPTRDPTCLRRDITVQVAEGTRPRFGLERVVPGTSFSAQVVAHVQ